MINDDAEVCAEVGEKSKRVDKLLDRYIGLLDYGAQCPTI